MLKYILVVVILSLHKGYATNPNCNLLQHSQLAALNERMNQMIQALYSSPFLSSIAKTKSSLRSQQSSNDYEPYTPPYQPDPSPPPPPFPIPSFPPIPASPPIYPQPPENSNVIYFSPKSAASPPSVTLSRTKYSPAEYRYPVEYREEYQPSKAVDPEVKRQEYYRSYYQRPAPLTAAETPVYDYSYYYPDSERPLRFNAAAQAQPSYLPPTPNAAQVPVPSSYSAASSGYAAPPGTAYPAPPSTAYATQPSAQYAASVPPNPSYAAPAPPSAYPSPVPPSPAYTAPVPPSPAYSAYAAPVPPAYTAPVPSAYAAPAPSQPSAAQAYADYYSRYYAQ